MRAFISRASLGLALLFCSGQLPSPSPTPDIPVWAGKPGVKYTVDARPLGVEPDGYATWLVVSHFIDADGRQTRVLANSDLDWTSPGTYVQWQTRWRYGQPAAIVRTTRDGPIALTVRANKPNFGTIVVHTDTRTWRGPRVVGRALGPHAVQIGWFPQSTATHIERIDERGVRTTVASIAGPNSTYSDDSVRPNARYRYVVYRNGFAPVRLAPVTTPALPPATSVANASGKAMWLFFSNDPTDPNFYARLDPRAIVDRAVRAGLHYVELRTAYGAYWEVTPEAKPTIDAIVDGLADHGIGTIGWTVPRDLTYDDLSQSVRTAYYRTARGTPFTGLAIDVERGDEFMGAAPEGLEALWLYMRDLRQALGSNYLLVATVEDPYLEHIEPGHYPFAAVARYSDVLQPMSYWRMMRRKPTTPQDVRVLLRASYEKLIHVAGRTMPVSIGGQTTAEGRNGNPPGDEIVASLETSRTIGAIGECFFAWDGTQEDQWEAIAGYRWR